MSAGSLKCRFFSSVEIISGLIRELVARGFDAEQSFQLSEADYRGSTSSLGRLFLRVHQYVFYPIRLVWFLGWARILQRFKSGSSIKVVVVSTNTFYAPLIATFLHRNVVHLVYDLFPEAMLHSGKWQEGTFKVRVVRWVVGLTLRRAKCNVFLGERLKDYVESIHGPIPNLRIIAVGADQSLFRQLPKRRLVRDELHDSLLTYHISPKILYCGNFGNMHDSETLFEYWNQLASSVPSVSSSEAGGSSLSIQVSGLKFQPSFHFHCSGPKRAVLEEVVSALPDTLQESVTIGDGLGQQEWIAVMEQADVALVSMAPGAETVVMPSKTYSAMMAGQAILAIAPENSDLVDLIRSADCGWWVEPGDVEGLAQALKEISAEGAALLEKRECAYHYAHAHFGQDRLAEAWIQLFGEL